jgi:paraquat-inducible protein A
MGGVCLGIAAVMTLGGRRFLLTLALLAASVCLALGISLPVIKLTKFVFLAYEHSLLSTVNALIRSGQLFMGAIVLVFGIFLPVMKLLYLLLLAVLPQPELARLGRQLRALAWLGKWSMQDVLALALSIFFVKQQGLFDARSLAGLYFFSASVLLMMLAHAWLKNDGRVIAPARFVRPYPIPMRGLALGLLIVLATLSFALGVVLPAIRFTTVYVWTNQHSIATILWALYKSDELLLCSVIFTFSILFPFLKLLYLVALAVSPDLPHAFRGRALAAMEWLGRYSMTDVMVLALVVFYVNASGYSEASVQPGVYFFAGSALLTMLAYGWVHSGKPGGGARPASLQARLDSLAAAQKAPLS